MNVQLSTRAIHSYRRSLKSWMGYVAVAEEGDRWSSSFATSAVAVLGSLIDPANGAMDDFLMRYRKTERDRRRREVRRVVLLWLTEFAE